jgi:hypothetical protein
MINEFNLYGNNIYKSIRFKYFTNFFSLDHVISLLENIMLNWKDR